METTSVVCLDGYLEFGAATIATIFASVIPSSIQCAVDQSYKGQLQQAAQPVAVDGMVTWVFYLSVAKEEPVGVAVGVAVGTLSVALAVRAAVVSSVESAVEPEQEGPLTTRGRPLLVWNRTTGCRGRKLRVTKSREVRGQDTRQHVEEHTLVLHFLHRRQERRLQAPPATVVVVVVITIIIATTTIITGIAFMVASRCH